MSRRIIVILGVIGVIAIIVVLIFIFSFNSQTLSNATINLIGGRSVQQILLVNNQYVYAVENNQLVRYEKSKQQAKQVLVDNMVAYSVSTQQQKIFVTLPVKSGQYAAKVYDTTNGNITDLKNTIGIVWFNNPLYLQLIVGPGLNQVQLVDNANKVVIGGVPIDDVNGFANRYVIYSLGEGSSPQKTAIYDTQQNKQVQEIQTAGDLEPRMYDAFMMYKDQDSFKIVNDNLKTIVVKSNLTMQNLSQNQNGQLVYTAQFTTVNSKSVLQINSIDLQTGNMKTIQNLLVETFSPFSSTSKVDSFWYDESGVGYVLSNGSIFTIHPEKKQ